MYERAADPDVPAALFESLEFAVSEHKPKGELHEARHRQCV